MSTTPTDPVRTAAIALLEAWNGVEAIAPFVAVLEAALALPVEQPAGPLETFPYSLLDIQDVRAKDIHGRMRVMLNSIQLWLASVLPASPSTTEPKDSNPNS